MPKGILDIAAEAKRNELRRLGAPPVKGPGLVDYAKAYWIRKLRHPDKPQKPSKESSFTLGVPMTLGGSRGQLKKVSK